ncbi:MAG: protein kinase [Acidobacteriota bacterium]
MTVHASLGQLIGERLGRYRISASLGHGGMAEVFRARDDKLGRDVAIKVVLPHFASEEQFLTRFEREAQVVASLEHPNILPIFDFGEHQGLPFLVMPLVRGGTLADRMQGEALDPSTVIAWVGQLAAALDAAHGQGVLHRDVKPGNVLVGREERLFLGDFGIAKLFDATRLTRTGTVVGTPLYMAPEVAGGKAAEAAADRYSLAVMTYELLAGSPPFEGDNVLSILHQHATCPVPPITDRVTGLAPGVDHALELGLAKDPTERPSTCRGFADLLAEQLPTGELAVFQPRPSSDSVRTLPIETPPQAATAASASTLETAATERMPAPPSGDAYATVHAPAGGLGQLKQWATAGLLGGLVALVALTVLQKDPEPSPMGGLAGGSPAVDLGASSGSSAATEPAVDPPRDDALAATGAVDTTQGAAETKPPQSSAVASEPPVVGASSEAPIEPTGIEPDVATVPPPTTPSAKQASRGPLAGRARGLAPATRLNALRSFSSRITAEDFERARETAHKAPLRSPRAKMAAATKRYAEGGLAYLAGDDEAAEQALREVLQEQAFVASWGPSPIMLLASDDIRQRDLLAWELALAYGDARGLAGDLLDQRLAVEPENARYRFARALVHRLDGEHAAVVREAAPVFHQLGAKDGVEARSYLALVIADAYAGLGRAAEAMEWFRRAIEIGGPFRGLSAMRAAEAARHLGQMDVALELLQIACDDDLQLACERLKSRRRR